MSTPPNDPTAGTRPHQGWSDEQVEQVVGNLLRVGVILSSLIVLTGGILYLWQDGSRPARQEIQGPGDRESVRRVGDVLREAWHLQSEALIELGLLLLIATPIARVVFSVVAFAGQRDFTYVLITLLVLVILIYSLFSGHVHD